jgi:hypothetical protein
LCTATHAPDGIVRTTPVGKWVTLRYEHDGYASLRIYMDGMQIPTKSPADSEMMPGWRAPC